MSSDNRPGPWKAVAAAALLAAVSFVPEAFATPYDYISVGSPIESELRILDLLDSRPLAGRLRLVRLGTRPLQPIELEGIGRPPGPLDPVREISIARIERILGRDRAPLFAPHPIYHSTTRWLEYGTEPQRLQVSAGLEGSGEVDRHDSRYFSGSGFHGRISAGLDRLVAYSHYVVGYFDDARRFADPIVPNNDFIVLTEETYLSYTDERGQWGAQFGRSRWHWGPGEEASLVLSKTSPALTGLAFRVRIEALRADAIALSATLKQASGEQLAAHRIEWQPLESLRLGVTETARYRGTGWQPLYLMGAIPYVLVQRVLVEGEPDSTAAHRNNIMTSGDVTWRIAEGTRLYGELLIDDIHARSGKNPNKLAYQVGWEGAGTMLGQRVTWGGEFTRLTRYVYTSHFGRDFQIQGLSLGFPTGPDARRVRVRANWDPSPDWQIGVTAAQLEKGENDITEPFLPGSPRVDSFTFQGVVETTRDVQLGVRWWPASGLDVRVIGGVRWRRDIAHVSGTKDQTPVAALELTLTR